MHKDFGEWYRNASLTVDGAVLTNRWAVIEKYPYSASEITGLLKVMFSDAASPDIEAGFSNRFFEADPAFRVKNNNAEISILAAATIAAVIESKSADLGNLPLFAAIGSLVANCGGLRQKRCLVPDVLTIAARFVEKASLERADWSVLLMKPETAAQRVPALQRALAVTAEESNILWWMFGETSRDSKRHFSSYLICDLAFVAGKELSDLTLIPPGQIAIAAILEKVISLAKGGPRKVAPFVDLIEASPMNLWEPNAICEAQDRSCPIRSAVRLRKELGQVWKDKAPTALGIRKSAKLAARDFALQVYLEHQWLAIRANIS